MVNQGDLFWSRFYNFLQTFKIEFSNLHSKWNKRWGSRAREDISMDERVMLVGDAWKRSARIEVQNLNKSAAVAQNCD